MTHKYMIKKTGHHHHAYGTAAELTVARLHKNALASSANSKTLQKRTSKRMKIKNNIYLISQ